MVATISAEKATWPAGTSWPRLNDSFPPHFATPAGRQAVTDLVMEHALRPDVAVRLTPDGLEPDSPLEEPAPPDSRRSNGESVLHEHGAARCTTQELLDAEQRLQTCAAQPTRLGLPPHRGLVLMRDFEQRHDVTLDAGRRAPALGFIADPRRLVVGIGPAGVPSEQSELLANRLEEASVPHRLIELPGARHGFDAAWGGWSSQIVRRELEEFLERRLADQDSDAR